MKPREFWIRENKNYPEDSGPLFYCSTAAPRPPSTAFLVREVVPIDWEKLWKKFLGERLFNEINIQEQFMIIEKLVEKQLRGEE